LEKTIAIDSTNPYGYYYLAKAHYHLGRYQESLNFLDVAESLLSGDAYWLAEVFALKGENFRALGFPERADSQYSEALRLNPANRVAAEGINHIQRQPQPSAR
jgi:tetratricopeptide (TPR) repeat protein